MVPLFHFVQQFNPLPFEIFLLFIALPIATWLLLHSVIPVISWVRIDTAIRSSVICRGPSLLHVLATSTSRQYHRVLAGWVREFGAIFWYRMGPLHVVMVTEPFLVAEVLRNTEVFDKSPFLHQGIAQGGSEKALPNLVSSPTNNKWQLIRKTVAPAFSLGRMKQDFPRIQAVVERVMAFLREPRHEAEPVNMTRVLSCEGLDLIGMVP
eukprot:jgi/Botrbrau1/20654/Bobra.0594s0001.1